MKYLVTALLLIVTFSVAVKSIFAYSSVLGAHVIAEQGITIGGVKAEDPTKEFTVNSQTPTFSGYTIPNAKVTLIIHSETKYKETFSDAYGFWTYTLDVPLEIGNHSLFLKVTDSNGNTSDEVLAASFVVSDVKGASTTSLPLFIRNFQFNYLSISMIVLATIVLLGIVYGFLYKRSSKLSFSA